MTLRFRFAILSDPHIALPHTIWNHPNRFHLVEVSILALEFVLERISHLDLDFLLIPGDLTQHGERENHAWLAQRLAQLPYPVYVVPGNHDVIQRHATERTIGLADFPQYYQKFGYTDPRQPYYTCEVMPGVRLIGLNSNDFDLEGKQIPVGYLDKAQLRWLKQVLAEAQAQAETVLVMLHHNVLEHLPGQAHSPLGRRYMLENASELILLLQQAGVQLMFTGHLHVQDIAHRHNLYEVTTGSLVSYPHPYRVLEFQQDEPGDEPGNVRLQVESGRVTQVEGWADLLHTSREWMGNRSRPFMLKLLTQPPLNLPTELAEQLAPELRYFWADIADGDAMFAFPHLPTSARNFLAHFSAHIPEGHTQPIDNFATLWL